MKRYLPFILIVLGLAIIFAGFVYDVLFAGIPYQDPTPVLTNQLLISFPNRICDPLKRVGHIRDWWVFLLIRNLKAPRQEFVDDV